MGIFDRLFDHESRLRDLEHNANSNTAAMTADIKRVFAELEKLRKAVGKDGDTE